MRRKTVRGQIVRPRRLYLQGVSNEGSEGEAGISRYGVSPEANGVGRRRQNLQGHRSGRLRAN